MNYKKVCQISEYQDIKTRNQAGIVKNKKVQKNLFNKSFLTICIIEMVAHEASKNFIT